MFRFLKNLILSVAIYGVILFVVHKYSGGWFLIEATEHDVFLTFLILAIIFWFINNIVKFVLKVLTIPLKYLTFGLFSLVLNMFLIYLFEYFVNNSSLGVIVHLGTIIQVFALSLSIALLGFLIKKII